MVKHRHAQMQVTGAHKKACSQKINFMKIVICFSAVRKRTQVEANVCKEFVPRQPSFFSNLSSPILEFHAQNQETMESETNLRPQVEDSLFL